MDNISLRKAQSIKDYLVLRSIRNKSYGFMSRYPYPINLFQQFKFWLKRRNHEIFIYSKYGVDICYVLFSSIDGNKYITIVVDLEKQSQSLGYECLINACNLSLRGEILFAEILTSNLRSIELFKKCGFKFLYSKNNCKYFSKKLQDE